jgi:hypothetical protein
MLPHMAVSNEDRLQVKARSRESNLSDDDVRKLRDPLFGSKLHPSRLLQDIRLEDIGLGFNMRFESDDIYLHSIAQMASSFRMYYPIVGGLRYVQHIEEYMIVHHCDKPLPPGGSPEIACRKDPLGEKIENRQLSLSEVRFAVKYFSHARSFWVSTGQLWVGVPPRFRVHHHEQPEYFGGLRVRYDQVQHPHPGGLFTTEFTQTYDHWPDLYPGYCCRHSRSTPAVSIGHLANWNGSQFLVEPLHMFFPPYIETRGVWSCLIKKIRTKILKWKKRSLLGKKIMHCRSDELVGTVEHVFDDTDSIVDGNDCVYSEYDTVLIRPSSSCRFHHVVRGGSVPLRQLCPLTSLSAWEHYFIDCEFVPHIGIGCRITYIGAWPHILDNGRIMQLWHFKVHCMDDMGEFLHPLSLGGLCGTPIYNGDNGEFYGRVRYIDNDHQLVMIVPNPTGLQFIS